MNLREEFLDRYPHEFSGGQAQRIGIARALAAKARILILDEPVSALDVSVQAQVLNLLADLRAEFDLTYLFISHDLAVVEAVSDRIAVLYFGSVVEIGPAEEVFAAPKHPYTKLLAESAPVVGRPLTAPEAEGTELPDPLNPPKGCAFAARCPNVTEKCRSRNAEPFAHRKAIGGCLFPPVFELEKPLESNRILILQISEDLPFAHIQKKALNVRFELPFQPIDATHSSNFSAGE